MDNRPYIETTRRIAKGEQITADYGEWFDYAQHIDPIRVGEHQEEDDTPESGRKCPNLMRTQLATARACKLRLRTSVASVTSNPFQFCARSLLHAK